MVFTRYVHGGHLEFWIMTFTAKFAQPSYKFLIRSFIKFAQYIDGKCHLNFFMNDCHDNQRCHVIFIKTSYM